MSTISALKVFSLFGKRRSCSEVSSTSAVPLGVPDRSRMSDIPATQPAWLQQILDGHQRELDASKQLNENFLKKFDEVVTAFRADYGALDQRQSEASQKIQALEDEMSELKTNDQIRQTDISAVDHRVDEVKAEVLAKIDALRSEFQAKLEGKAAPHPDRPVIPSSSTVAAVSHRA
jgi:chromosome segregation ATPase